MMKLISLLDRRPGLDLAGFSHYWRTTHRELALRLVAPGIMRAYVQNHRLAWLPDGMVAAGDGCPEVWVDDAAAVARLRDCPEYLQGAALDEANFMSGGARMTITRTRTVTAGPGRAALAGQVKLMLFLADDIAVPDAGADHGCVLMPGARPLRLERDIAVTDWPDSLAPPCCRHVESSWWPSLEALEQAWSQVSGKGVQGIVVREEVAIAPHETAD